MKLNLGCGTDVREGYLNVDFRDLDMVEQVDLSKMPWPWPDASADEVLMLDFLEHFPYARTEDILTEAWRVLKPGAPVFVQVPSFEECAIAMMENSGMLCNACGFEWTEGYFLGNESAKCGKCGQPRAQVVEAAMKRLYGGQDYQGNFHFTAFTQNSLARKLLRTGFTDITALERNENGETYRQNWNMKLRAVKGADLWSEA